MSEGAYASSRKKNLDVGGVDVFVAISNEKVEKREGVEMIIETVAARRVRIENLLKKVQADLEIAIDDERFYRGIRYACDRDDLELHKKLQANMENAQKKLEVVRAERDRILELLEDC